MKKDKYILALDQGTTSSRSILYNSNFEHVATAHQEFKQSYPQRGWVEHDSELIWESQIETAKAAIAKSKVDVDQIAGIGITNQREITIIWNRETGKPVYPGIVWQDRRTASFCKSINKEGRAEEITEKTGLVVDPYFSATKIHWILKNVEGAKELAIHGKLAFGTVDTWLIWKLTGGKPHITDVSNASRTMVFNIHTLQWDEELLGFFGIPKSMMPEIVENTGVFAYTETSIFGKSIPITGIAGDQQSALFGQLCLEEGMAKCTYGTGCFLMLNTGSQMVKSSRKMLTTIGWKINGEITYALEGSVFIGGAVIQWLRDKLEFFVEAADSESLAEAADDNGGVYFVPALTGLGAPYWDANARGAIFGITRGTTKANLTRAALESICFQVNDILKVMAYDLKNPILELRVDGGAASNDLLLQFQSDISKINVLKPSKLEITSLGVAFLSSIGAGIHTLDSIKNMWSLDQEFRPELSSEQVKKILSFWDEAIKRSLDWPS